MPNEAEGSLDKRTNSLESAAQVSPQKSGPYDLTKSEAASTIDKKKDTIKCYYKFEIFDDL